MKKQLKKNIFFYTFLLFGIFVVCLFAEILAPHSFYEQNVDFILTLPSSQYWLGTDSLGRDIFSRLLYGGRVSLFIGFVTVFFSLIIGFLYGGISGYLGGRFDSLMMRFVDGFDSIPSIVLFILIKMSFDSFFEFEISQIKSLVGIVFALSLTGWLNIARLTRGEVLKIKKTPYIEWAFSLGASPFRILFIHILPNILPPLLVLMVFQLPSHILFESFLSFIGLGLQPPYSSWGVMAYEGWQVFYNFPYFILPPSLALFFIVFIFKLWGENLRKYFSKMSQFQTLN